MDINVANTLYNSRKKRTYLVYPQVWKDRPACIFQVHIPEAKVSGVAVVLYRLLSEKVVNMLSSSRNHIVYCEFKKPSTGDLFQGTYDDDTKCITWNRAAPTGFEQLLPFILYAFHPTSPLPNTQEKLKDLLGKFIANGDVEDSSYVCCDDFYYEFLKYYPSRRFAVETDLDLETIKQGYRTEQLIEPSELVGLSYHKGIFQF